MSIKQEIAKKIYSPTYPKYRPMKYEEYSKLSPKQQEYQNKGEREYNFNKKMDRKYGLSGHDAAVKKLGKFF
jgi:hypothetical protein